jgi:hypothetical protein
MLSALSLDRPLTTDVKKNRTSVQLCVSTPPQLSTLRTAFVSRTSLGCIAATPSIDASIDTCSEAIIICITSIVEFFVIPLQLHFQTLTALAHHLQCTEAQEVANRTHATGTVS